MRSTSDGIGRWSIFVSHDHLIAIYQSTDLMASHLIDPQVMPGQAAPHPSLRHGVAAAGRLANKGPFDVDGRFGLQLYVLMLDLKGTIGGRRSVCRCGMSRMNGDEHPNLYMNANGAACTWILSYHVVMHVLNNDHTYSFSYVCNDLVIINMRALPHLRPSLEEDL